MAVVCTNCGQDLPRDDAHFCNHCGTLVPSHPFSSQSLSAASSASSKTRQERQKPVLREQRVQQLTVKPEQLAPQVQTRPRTTRRIAPDDLAKASIAWPAPLTHVSVKEHISPQDVLQDVPQDVAHEELHAHQEPQDVAPHSAPPMPELHVKVWEQEHTNPPTPLPASSNAVLPGHVEDTPTTPLEAAQSAKIEDTPPLLQDKGIKEHRDDVEHRDTVPMPNYPLQPRTVSYPQSPMTSQNSLHGNTALPVEQRQVEQRQQGYVPTSVPSSYVGTPQQSARISQAPSSLPPAPRQKSRLPFILLLAFLCILILGVGAWFTLANPFSVPSVTQPLQSYKDTQLGVSLSYPNSWSTQRNATGIVFADSSHTAQMKLAVVDANGGSATQYIQQQATKNGMTAIKSLGMVSFAGASWSQVQGNMQQDGVNYTTDMLATVHGNRMYVLIQMAPQNVYADEESVVFSAIRNSFTFL